MPKYLTLPRLRLKGVNAQPAWWCIAPPGPVTYLGFAQDLAIKMGWKNQNPSVALVLHDWTLRAESDIDWKVLPHQFRAAALINGDDYAQGSKTLAGQPTVRGDAVVTLILELDDDEAVDLRRVQSILDVGKAAGGVIEQHEFSHHGPCLQITLERTLQRVRSGFTLIDRADLLAAAPGADPLDKFLAATQPGLRDPKANKEEQESRESWLVPYSAGWFLLTDPEPRPGAREGLPHAFAEQLIGLGQFASLRQTKPAFWSLQRDTRRLIQVHQRPI